MDRPYKIAMVSSKNIRDRNTLSGSSFHILAALREYVGEVVIIDQLKPPRHSFINIIRFFDFYWRFILVTARQLWGQMTSRNYRWERTPLISKYYAKMIQKRIKGQSYDFILADKGAIEIAYLKPDIPILYLADATFKLMIDAYNDYTDVSAFEFSALSGPAKKNGHLLESKAIGNSYRCLYYSNWAAQSAMKHYSADPEKVTVIGQGPYLDLLPGSRADEMREVLPGNECHLLLVGVDWERKGCNIAVDALTALRDMGIEAYLNICGCQAPSGKRLPGQVNVIPFLDKSRDSDLQNLVWLYEGATYFIFPTRAECFGVVLLEALFFGVPVLKSFTGHMIFGFGQASYYSTTYQEIFGLKFYPSDLGIIGVAFKYGLVGVVMYIFFNIYVIVRLLKVNWFLRKLKGQHNPLVWALLIMKTSLFINLILQPGLVFAPGLTLASFSIAYTACWYEELGVKSRHHQVSAKDIKGVYAVST